MHRCHPPKQPCSCLAGNVGATAIGPLGGGDRTVPFRLPRPRSGAVTFGRPTNVSSPVGRANVIAYSVANEPSVDVAVAPTGRFLEKRRRVAARLQPDQDWSRFLTNVGAPPKLSADLRRSFNPIAKLDQSTGHRFVEGDQHIPHGMGLLDHRLGPRLLRQIHLVFYPEYRNLCALCVIAVLFHD